MEDSFPIVLRAFQSMFALYGLVYIVSALWWPEWFLDTISVNYIDRRHAKRQGLRNIMPVNGPWYSMPAALLTLIAIGVLIYAMTYAVVAVVPYSWGGTDEDGDWHSTRYWLQFSAAFIGSFGLATRLEQNAETLVWGPAERNARQTITQAIRFARHTSPDANDRILQHLEQKLAPEPNKARSFGQDYAERLYNWIRGDIRG